jgi:hypothetical protein
VVAKKKNNAKNKTTKPDEVQKPLEDPDVKPEEQEEESPVVEGIPVSEFKSDKTIILKELPKGLTIPPYFRRPSGDTQIKALEHMHAMEFLRGPLLFGNKEISISARVTYIGTRRFLSKQVKVGYKSTSPYTNFLRIVEKPVRFWRNQETVDLIKDPDFIYECFASTNWQIRLVVDVPLERKEAKEKLFARNKEQWLGHKLRIRVSAIQLGQKVPLHPGEAELILAGIQKKEIHIAKEHSHILKYLQSMKERDIKAKIKENEKA